MKKIVVLTLLFIPLLFIVSCGNEEQVSSNEDTLVAKSGYNKDEFKNYYTAVKERYKFILYGVHADTVAYFVTANSSFKVDNFLDEMNFNSKKVKLGLVDFEGNEILSNEYKKIGNIGVLGSNLVEMEDAKGKYGLCNLKSGKFISCDYDLIVPNKTNGGDIIAYLKKGTTFFTLKEDFTIETSNLSDFSKCLALNRSSFNAFEKGVYFYILGEDIEYESFSLTNHDGSDYESYYTMNYLTPNYIYRFYTDKQLFMGIESDNSWGGIYALNGKVESTESKNGMYSFIVSFFYEGSDARGYSNEEGKIVTMNANNDIIAHQSIFYVSDYESYSACSITRSHKFVKSNLLEVLVHKHSSEYYEYDVMPIYTYFSIDEKGYVKEVTPKGVFGFVSMVPITKSMLECCTGKYIQESEIPEGMGEEINYVTFAHYSIEDLEMMISEVMARYGYNFSDNEELKAYFNTKSWYSGTKSDVSNLFTELEKSNINIIVDVIMSMKDKEDTFRKPKYTTFYAAG